MNIGYPKLKIKDRSWFMANNDQIVFGVVLMISIVIKDNGTNIWYTMLDEFDNKYTVAEKELLENNYDIPTPKYRIGDLVEFEYFDEGGAQIIESGEILSMEIGQYDKSKPFEVMYYLNQDPNYQVLENEILGFLDRDLTTVKQLSAGYDE